MRKVAIINQKGGVGKTTTAVNLSAALADTGQRVLLLDLDPQAHASLHLGAQLEAGAASMYEVFTGDARLSDVCRQVAETLWLAPAHIDLAAVEVELSGEVGREMFLRDHLATIENDFDYILVDCPPSLGILTINALATVDEVFIPLQPHFLALHGLSKLLETIDLVARRINSKLRLGGVVLCMYDAGTRLAAEVSRDVTEYFTNIRGQRSPWREAHAFETRIRRNIRLAEAPSFGQTIFQYAPDSNGSEDYRRLAAEILEKANAAAQHVTAAS